MRPAEALQAKRLLATQAIIGSFAALFALPFGAPVALAVSIGAGACLLANALFAVWVFRGYRAREPARIVRQIYFAEAGKIVLLIGILALGHAVIEGTSVPVLLGAYALVQMTSVPIAVHWDARRVGRAADG